VRSKAGFQLTQRMQRTQRIYELTQTAELNETTSLLGKLITAASDDGICQAVADTREINEIKLNLHHKLHNK